jgi:hypothetical protein
MKRMKKPLMKTMVAMPPDLGETGPLSRGVQARRKTLRIRHTNGMEVRKKRPRGFKKEAQGVQASPLNPLSVAPCALHGPAVHLEHGGVVCPVPSVRKSVKKECRKECRKEC